MALSSLKQKITSLVEPSMHSMGYDIVRIKLFDGDHKTLQIMAERLSDGELGIEDCEKISKTISTLLDIEDPISDEYSLEVSSPGIDRPLVRPKDFQRYAGFTAKLQTHLPIDGRRCFKGKILGFSDEKQEISIKTDDVAEQCIIAMDNLETAKLVLTDELLASTKHLAN